MIFHVLEVERVKKRQRTEWTFISTGQILSEEYAPTAISIDDTIYFLASEGFSFEIISKQFFYIV